MKFFISEDHWDLAGYQQNLQSISHRFDSDTAEFVLNHSFHDASIKDMKLVNHFDNNSKEDMEDPTTIIMIIKHYDDLLYEVIWSQVRRFFFDFDITRNVYANSDSIAFDGMRGIDEWGYDEITTIDDKLLSHEIDLFSQTKIIIICTSIQIKLYTGKSSKL